MHRALTLVGLALPAIALLWLQQGSAGRAGAEPRAAPQFQDVSRAAGLTGNRVVSLEMAIGQAWGDYDNDGWADLYVTDPAGPNTLYRNNGDGTFTRSPLTEQVALPQAHSAGATWADFDNDGWRDLFVANWGTDALFRNEGGQRFVNITEQAGIRDSHNTKSASWGDFDNDGFLDLYLANWSCYPKCGRPMEGDPDKLYRNNGDGTFTDVSHYLGGSLNGAGFIASFNDYDNDGDADIYLVNDEWVNGIGNKLWRNDGPGCLGWCFTQVAEQSGAASKLFGMGLAVGDYDNDGDLDYYYSNAGPMELLQNQGDGTFREVAEAAGVQAANGIGWGAVFFDYDNDGWRDLYLAIADTTDHKDIAANRLFRNNRDGTFTAIACDNEASDVRMSMGVAYADYDRDGWVDLLVGNMDEGYRLYRNRAGETTRNHWLALELRGGGRVNRDAVGARVMVTTPDGVTQTQEVINGSGLGGGNELVLYFGLGAATRADVSVHWPDGRRQEFRAVAGDRRYQLRYPLEAETRLEPDALGPALPATSPDRTSAAIATDWAPMLLTLLGLGLLAGVLLALRLSPAMPHRAVVPALIALIGVGLLVLGGSALRDLMPQSDDARLRALMEQAGVRRPTLPPAPRAELVKLGEALFWDPELSGNRDISCATCHHPLKGTGDNLSVSIGTGGVGLGEQRIRLEERRDFIPRNASPLFNLGYLEWKVLFWDGRLSGTPATGFDTPASDRLPAGLDNLLAAQAMFPVTSRDEMRGLRGDVDIFGRPNELAMLPDYTARPIWSALMKRLLAIPGYVELFRAAYPDVPVEELGFQHAANALAAYQSVTFTFEDSPFDRYLHGETDAFTEAQKRGALLFYGEAGCATCHSGGLLTDQKFHNLAVPQLGDGKGREQPFDFGRARETGNDCERYAFRTPPLRNVAITGPWMHNGAFTTLEAAVRHHLNPEASLRAYDPEQLAPNLRETCQDDPAVLASILKTKSANASERAALTDNQIRDLLAFLESLTSPSALNLSHTIPASVPSGLPVGGNIGNPDVSALGNTGIAERP
ncbi:MAG: FG-GAP-like repeat-containing protein [Anaerolineales bacterium]|nr:FG-GAP-like repeat-containing protein [Anaerolineales bacterium]